MNKVEFALKKVEIEYAALMSIWIALVLFCVVNIALFASRMVITDKTTSVCREVSVEQTFNFNGGKVTMYKCLIQTDDGVFEITNEGMLASPSFGTIEEGKEYVFRTRGVSIPSLGIYPYISIVE